MKRIIMLVGLLWASSWQARAVGVDQEELCATLQKSPWDDKAMLVMQSVMRNEREPAALRSRAMAICALSLIKQGNTNQFVRAVQILESMYSAEKGLVTVTVAEQYITCPACEGKGKRAVGCPACKGSTCPRCNGTRSIQTTCSACMGAGKQFKLNPSVLENYNRLLAEMLAFSRETQRFEKQSALALAEKDNDKRIALLETLQADFSKRTDMGLVKKSLEEAKKIRDVTLARKREQDKREKEEAAVERMRDFRQAATSESRVVAIREIEDYLIKNPKCFARSELDEIKNELTSKENIRNRLITSGFWLGGICVVFVVATFARIAWESRKVEKIRPLPGMDHIDKSKFTDPLADERERTEERRRGEKS
ncbi:MAG: hypothetical protein WCJ02_04555 [bacterium]